MAQEEKYVTFLQSVYPMLSHLRLSSSSKEKIVTLIISHHFCRDHAEKLGAKRGRTKEKKKLAQQRLLNCTIVSGSVVRIICEALALLHTEGVDC